MMKWMPALVSLSASACQSGMLRMTPKCLAGTLLGAAFWLLLASLAFGTTYLPSGTGSDWVLPAAGLFACLSFIPYFELQRVAGPVYLSQIGYVMAATSLAIGTFVFGERYGLLVWIAAAIIVAGILLVNRRPVQS